MVAFSFWCEGGSQIGFGHVRRCLALAAEVRSRGIYEIFFVLRESAHEISEIIKSAGFAVRGERSTDLLKSRYAFLDIASHEIMKKSRLLEERIEDARHHANFLIWVDSFEEDSIVAHPNHRFDCVLTPYLGAEISEPPNCKVWLSGAKYAVLDPIYRKKCDRPASNPSKPRLLVSMGGADEPRLTERVLDSSADYSNLQRRVIIGPLFLKSRIAEIKIRHPDCEIISGRQNIRDDLCLSDFFVTSPGLTRYEAAAIGIPTLILSKERRYERYLRMFEESELARVVFAPSPIDDREIRNAILELIRNQPKVSGVASVVDGLGSKRVIDSVMANFGSKN